MTEAYGWPVTSRLLNSSSGDRIRPGLNGASTHQLYEIRPAIPSVQATVDRAVERRGGDAGSVVVAVLASSCWTTAFSDASGAMSPSRSCLQARRAKHGCGHKVVLL